MKVKDRYDVVIVGAGPAGTAAGKVLARNGLDVLIADRARFPRTKLCGGGLTPKTVALLKEIFGVSPVDKIAHVQSREFALYNRTRFINSYTDDKQIHLISRLDLDNMLLNGAMAAGCDFSGDTFVNEFDNQHVYLNGVKVRYKYLIGADGVNSNVRRHIGKRLNKKDIATALQFDIPEIDTELKVKIYFGYVKYGYAWIFPKKAHTSVGIACLDYKKRKVKQNFEDFLKDIGLYRDYKKYDLRGALLPYGTYIEKPYKDNILLVGDAAGYVEPLSGEGIYFALLSGKYASEAILEPGHEVGKAYENKCRHDIIGFFRQAKLSRPLVYRRPFMSITLLKMRKSDDVVRYYIELISGKIDYKSFFRKSLFA